METEGVWVEAGEGVKEEEEEEMPVVAEDSGEVGVKSGENGRSGKRALERVVVEDTETVVPAPEGAVEKSGEEVEVRSGGKKE